MQVYLVGGAVRDGLLGLSVRERDWVVVGANAELMRDQGYLQVGHDFPVFLHPTTHEEYALARTERKSGSGHLGFACDAASEVTLEQDLQRRDLTINAIAQASDGSLIDPYGGQRDLQQRWLRHIGPAFTEDPLRVLRVARFAACYAALGFRIAPETLNLMQSMAASGELDHLTAERIYQETAKALRSAAPHIYFATLHYCQALSLLFPELTPLFQTAQPMAVHLKQDNRWHPLLALELAATLSDDLAVRFAVLCQSFGQPLLHVEAPHQPRYDSASLDRITAFCARLKVPKALCTVALLVARVHALVHRIKDLAPPQLLELLNAIDVWRKPQRLTQIVLACQADLQGRTGFSRVPYPQADYLLQAYVCGAAVNVQQIVASGASGAAIGQALQQRRLQALQQWMQAPSSRAEDQ